MSKWLYIDLCSRSKTGAVYALLDYKTRHALLLLLTLARVAYAREMDVKERNHPNDQGT